MTTATVPAQVTPLRQTAPKVRLSSVTPEQVVHLICALAAEGLGPLREPHQKTQQTSREIRPSQGHNQVCEKTPLD